MHATTLHGMLSAGQAETRELGAPTQGMGAKWHQPSLWSPAGVRQTSVAATPCILPPVSSRSVEAAACRMGGTLAGRVEDGWQHWSAPSACCPHISEVETAGDSLRACKHRSCTDLVTESHSPPPPPCSCVSGPRQTAAQKWQVVSHWRSSSTRQAAGPRGAGAHAVQRARGREADGGVQAHALRHWLSHPLDPPAPSPPGQSPRVQASGGPSGPLARIGHPAPPCKHRC